MSINDNNIKLFRKKNITLFLDCLMELVSLTPTYNLNLIFINNHNLRRGVTSNQLIIWSIKMNAK